MELSRKRWGRVDNHNIHLFTVEDSRSGFKVVISDLGATILSVHTPDKEGNIDNIIYGHTQPETYLTTVGYLGATIGRVANRIRNSRFELEGKIYRITANHKISHQLHGGLKGFDKQVWNVVDDETGMFNDEVRITFQYLSNDGEEGFPGNLTTKLRYRIRPMVLEWEFHATTDKTTILNLTNHAYWNLNGIHSTINDLVFTLYAKKYCIVDSDLIPTGEVKEFPLDLTKSTSFQSIFEKFGDVDHNFFLINYLSENTALDVFPSATVFSPKTGRVMIVETSEPCIQVYTGNFMEQIKSYNIPCKKHGAVCLETQRVPNAINIKEFRNMVILKPNEKYRHRTRHIFKIKS